MDLAEFLRLMSVPEHLRGSNTHGGHPVSLNEARDISRPFQDSLGGKVLVDLGRANGGVQLVERSLLPKQKYLSNGGANGVEFVEGIEAVNFKRPQYSATGWRVK